MVVTLATIHPSLTLSPRLVSLFPLCVSCLLCVSSQMTERHAVNLLDFQRTLQAQMAERPPKWSGELLEWRRRQHMLAKQKNYAEAQRIKKTADKALSQPAFFIIISKMFIFIF